MQEQLTDKERERFKCFQLVTSGKSQKEAARILKRPPLWVTRTMRRINERGDFEDRNRSGAPHKVSNRDHKRLVKMIKGKHGKSTRKISKIFKTKLGKKIGRETIRKELKYVEGLFPHRQQKEPLLTPAQKVKRVEYAKKHLRDTFDDVAFYDEKDFILHAPPNRKNDIIWDDRGVQHGRGEVAHPPKYRVAGAITARGATRLVCYSGNLNSSQYQEVISDIIGDINEMYPDHKWRWFQDSARPHISKSTTDFLKANVPSFFPKSEKPANSPDTNIMENAYGTLQDIVSEKNPQSVHALKRLVNSEWKKITPENCSKYISDLPRRMKEIIATKGEYVR